MGEEDLTHVADADSLATERRRRFPIVVEGPGSMSATPEGP